MDPIKVSNEVGAECLTQEDGAKIYDLILPVLTAGQQVRLDFTGVEVFASLFFNNAIGRLLKDFSPEDLTRLLLIEGLSGDGRDVLRRVIENAKDYYGNAAVRSALAKVMTEEH